MTDTAVPVFAGAWRRIGAFAIDAFVLGLVGITIGYFAFEALVGLGTAGRLVGFLIAMAYFVPLNSKLGGGQTLGKRLLRIKVIRADGTALPLLASLVRYAVIGIPWFLNNAWLPISALAPPWIYLITLLVFGAGLAHLYLFLFNRPTRQSLHDLAAGSFVVSAEQHGPVIAAPLARIHVIVPSVIAALTLLLPGIATRLIEQEQWASLMRVYHSVDAQPMVMHAQVNRGFTTLGDGNTTYLQVVAYLSEPRIDEYEIAQRLARLALEGDPSAAKLDVLQVLLVYGYDIGIASAHRSMAHRKAPAEWAQ